MANATHQHRYEDGILTHAHVGGGDEHGYFEHPEDLAHTLTGPPVDLSEWACPACGGDEIHVTYKTTVTLVLREGEPWSVTVDDELGDPTEITCACACGYILSDAERAAATASADGNTWPSWEIGW